MSIDAQLRSAADHYDLDAARSLIREGADINAADDSGATALHLATCLDYPQEGADPDAMIDLLIKSGCEHQRCHVGRFGRRFITRSAYLNHDLIGRLIAAGADVTLRNDEGQMPIHIPLDCGRIGDVRSLSWISTRKRTSISSSHP